VRLHIPDQQLRVSQRLPLGVAILAALSTAVLWPGLHRWTLLIWIGWAPAFFFALRYATGSWVRVSLERGISWRLMLPSGELLGSIAVDPGEITELRLESSLLARLLGLWDLQLVKGDGSLTPRLRFFEGIVPVAEALHARLQQEAGR
jgi:hypothetical protein